MESRYIWPFELLDKLGEGGMGVVYRARYVGNNRQVAVKLVPPDVASNETLLARFERELDVLKQLRHPHIVHCFGGTCESQQRYYAMELIEGGTLADLLRQKGNLSPEVAIDYALQMCDALQYAHERGVIHRDVKPGNFLLTRTGQIKLSDFGLATVVSANRLTAVGRTLGTIEYMAPEQIRGKPPLTNRADLYALGCVIYEMLVGHTPFQGNNPAEVLHKHLKDPIPHVAASMLECPLELDELVCRLLSKDPEQRPESAADVSRQLEMILLPGKGGGGIEPDLFMAQTPRAPMVARLEGIKESDASIEVQPDHKSRGRELRAWGVVACLALVCVMLWNEWRATAAKLRHAEQQWVDLLQRPDVPTRVLAVRSLAKFDPLSSIAVDKLYGITKDASEEVRVAALTSIKERASAFRSHQVELFKLQNTDPSPTVRNLAAQTVDAIKQTKDTSTAGRAVFWTVVIVLLGGIAAGGWWLWERIRPYA